MNPQDPSRVIPHREPSHLGNRYTREGIDHSRERFRDISRVNPNAVKVVRPYETRYRDQYRQMIFNRGKVVSAFWHDRNHRYYYSHWFNRGFYGGDWYPVRPVYDVSRYFYYPAVFWMFYTGDDTAAYYNGYYSGWYDDEPAPAPTPNPNPRPAPTPGPGEPAKGFPFRGVFYPTDTLRDLGIEVSAWSRDAQKVFREGLTLFVQELQDAISAQLSQSITLRQYEVVVNHYENLQDKALVIEGFDDRAGLHYSFKALIDLEDPAQTLVFVPTSQDPGGDNDPTLTQINDRIRELGGDPYSADQEPEKGAGVNTNIR